MKTKKYIREAFLELRRKFPLEKIKVTDICQKALINKSTFYKYYTDVYNLSDILEQESFQEFWDDFQNKDKLLEDTEVFFEGLHAAMKTHLEPGSTMELLYRGRMHVFFEHLEEALRMYYLQVAKSAQDEIQITFILIGALHTFQYFWSNKKYDDKIIVKSVVNIVQSLKETMPYLSTPTKEIDFSVTETGIRK